MSDAAYARLSPEMQALVDETTGPDRAAWFGSLWDEGEAEGRQYMVDAGVEIVQMTDAQLDQMKASFSSIVEGALGNAGDDGQAFLDAYTQ